MRYKVLIQQCSDPRCAGAVAFGVARRAGIAPEKVFSVISEKNICIRKKAQREEAMQLKREFEALGATVDLVQLDGYPVGGGDAPVVSHRSESDEDEDPSGRILTESEYAERMRDRRDIFYIENNRPLSRIETVCLVTAILAGLFMSTRESVQVASDFIEPNTPQREAIVLATPIERPDEQKRNEKPKSVSLNSRKVLRPAHTTGRGGKAGGGGNPRERVVKTGILGLVSGKIRGREVANADIFSKGGFSDGIDAIIQGMGGLKSLGGGGSGRRGITGIGYGTGYGNSGFGGDGPGNSDDILGLMSDPGEVALQLKTRTTELRIARPNIVHGCAITGGRSRQSIARVVQQNLAALRYAYNQRLREKPGLKGRITVKFAIDEFGNVLHCAVEESTISDSDLETVVIAKITRWKFEKINKVGDITEVIYPFVFSQ
ncbi:MAG: AgmX/PglI C-terminal domain-containing protein [Chitinispirillaceae bacterium]|nr:AgmX/PglI C-terminal domain-containing protein [Chitinispirillaceae bacterium]